MGNKRRMNGHSGVAMAVAAAFLGWSGAALAAPTFTTGPQASVFNGLITFNDQTVAQGTTVGNQFFGDGATFQNFTFDTGTLGQDGAPGFSGAGLVSGITTTPSGNLVIQFTTLVSAAEFAIADSGAPRVISAYLGGTGGILIDSTVVTLPKAAPINTFQARQDLASANQQISSLEQQLATAKSRVSNDTQRVTSDQSKVQSAFGLVTSLTFQVTADHKAITTCGAVINCLVQANLRLIKDTGTLADANTAYNTANNQLTFDEDVLADDQGTEGLLQISLGKAKEQLAVAELELDELSQFDPSSGFIGFDGTVFDTLVISDAADPTAIDDIEFTSLLPPPPPPPSRSVPEQTTVPEPSTTSLLAGALVVALIGRGRTILRLGSARRNALRPAIGGGFAEQRRDA